MHPEEIANSLTHGAGLALSLAGFVVLIVVAVLYGSALTVASCAIYGASLIAVYASSTVYHSLVSPRWKRVFLRVDHCCIYLLIAGTYTPVVLLNLRGSWGWSLFGVVWGLALLGILFKLWFADRFPILSTLGYLAMGWLCLIAFKPMLASVPAGEMRWLVAGALFYTTGIVFFAWRRLPFSHAIWHLFVMSGSACHYVAVLGYLATARG